MQHPRAQPADASDPVSANGAEEAAQADGSADAGTAQLRLGLYHLQQGEYERAIVEFTGVLRHDAPHGPARPSAAAFAHRGEAYRLKGDYLRALADFNAAHRLDPDNARILSQRGLVRWATTSPSP